MSVLRAARNRVPRTATRGLAFYDLDGTLVDLNLVHLMFYLLTNLGEWSGRLTYLLRFVGRLPALYLAERRDRHLLNLELFESFRGISRDRLEVLGEEYCDRVLMSHLYPQARLLLEANRASGLEAVVVSGSPDFVIAPLAERLGVLDYAANRLSYRGGLATGRLRAPVIAGEQKTAWCQAYAESRRVGLAACWGYADSYYDLPFLAAMGHPVAVNPDSRLAAAARSRQWPIVRFAKAAPRYRSDNPAGGGADDGGRG